ncbi:hypothetical protein ACLUX0_08510 [Limosilactobacillus mucosae]
MTKNLPTSNTDNAEFWINLNYSDLINQLQHKIDQQHQLDNLNKLQKATYEKIKEANHEIILAQNELDQNPQAEKEAVENYQAQCRQQAIDKLIEDLLKIDPEFQHLDSEVKKMKDQAQVAEADKNEAEKQLPNHKPLDGAIRKLRNNTYKKYKVQHNWPKWVKLAISIIASTLIGYLINTIAQVYVQVNYPQMIFKPGTWQNEIVYSSSVFLVAFIITFVYSFFILPRFEFSTIHFIGVAFLRFLACLLSPINEIIFSLNSARKAKQAAFDQTLQKLHKAVDDLHSAEYAYSNYLDFKIEENIPSVFALSDEFTKHQAQIVQGKKQKVQAALEHHNQLASYYKTLFTQFNTIYSDFENNHPVPSNYWSVLQDLVDLLKNGEANSWVGVIQEYNHLVRSNQMIQNQKAIANKFSESLSSIQKDINKNMDALNKEIQNNTKELKQSNDAMINSYNDLRSSMSDINYNVQEIKNSVDPNKRN